MKRVHVITVAIDAEPWDQPTPEELIDAIDEGIRACTDTLRGADAFEVVSAMHRGWPSIEAAGLAQLEATR